MTNRKRLAMTSWLAVLTGMLFLLNGCMSTSTRSYNQFYGVGPELMDEDGPSKGGTLMDRSEQELLARAYQYLATEDYQLAQLHFFSALQKNPHLPAAYAGVGETYLRQGASTEAFKAFSLALEGDPRNLRSLQGLGRLHREAGNGAMAEKHLLAALEAGGNAIELKTELALTYDAMDRFKEAELLYLELLTLNRSAVHYNNLGFNYFLQGDYTKSIIALNQALDLEPGNQRAMNNLAVVHALTGNEERAILLMAKSVGKAAAYNNLGYIYMSKGMYNRAEQAYRRAIEIKPSFYELAKENLNALEIMRAESVMGE